MRLHQSTQEERWRDALRQNNQALGTIYEKKCGPLQRSMTRNRNSVEDKTRVKLVMRSVHLLTLDRYFVDSVINTVRMFSIINMQGATKKL